MEAEDEGEASLELPSGSFEASRVRPRLGRKEEGSGKVWKEKVSAVSPGDDGVGDVK